VHTERSEGDRLRLKAGMSRCMRARQAHQQQRDVVVLKRAAHDLGRMGGRLAA